MESDSESEVPVLGNNTEVDVKAKEEEEQTSEEEVVKPALKINKRSKAIAKRHQRHSAERKGLQDFVRRAFRKSTTHRLNLKGGAVVQSRAFVQYAQCGLYALVADITRKAAVCTRMRDCQTLTPQDVVLGVKHSVGTTLYPCQFVDKKPRLNDKKTIQT